MRREAKSGVKEHSGSKSPNLTKSLDSKGENLQGNNCGKVKFCGSFRHSESARQTSLVLSQMSNSNAHLVT